MIATGQESKDFLQSFQPSIKFFNSLETEEVSKAFGYKKISTCITC